MGTYNGILSPEGIGLVVVRFKGKLYPFPTLARSPLVNDRFNEAELVVYYSRADGTAVAWSRRLNDRALSFETSARTGAGGLPLLADRETGSLWSWLTGEAVEGKLRGARLEPVSHNPILLNRFRAFYPDGPIFQR